MEQPKGKIESPCDSTCEIDNNLKVCKGCFRSIDEIAEWSEMSNTDKLMVYSLIEKRKRIYQIYGGKTPPNLESVS